MPLTNAPTGTLDTVRIELSSIREEITALDQQLAAKRARVVVLEQIETMLSALEGGAVAAVPVSPAPPPAAEPSAPEPASADEASGESPAAPPKAAKASAPAAADSGANTMPPAETDAASESSGRATQIEVVAEILKAATAPMNPGEITAALLERGVALQSRSHIAVLLTRAKEAGLAHTVSRGQWVAGPAPGSGEAQEPPQDPPASTDGE